MLLAALMKFPEAANCSVTEAMAWDAGLQPVMSNGTQTCDN